MDPAPERPSREPWIFLAACLVCGLAFQGSRGLFETDEGRYAECAREMLTSGRWFLPTLQRIPHLTKPPGAYWLIAAGLEVLGRNEWGARVALGLAFGAAAWLVRVIGRVLLGGPGGARAGWIYLGMAYPFAAGSILTTDTFLVAFELASIACIAVATTRTRPGLWLAAAGAALGGAFFVKGHPALVPWVAFVAALVVRRTAPAAGWQRWGTLLGLSAAVGIVLGVLWFVWTGAIVPGAADHFDGEIVSRLTGPGDHKERQWWFYFLIVVGGVLPWWVAAVGGMRRLRLGDAGRALLVWAGLTFLVFEVVPAKMPLYVLPVAAPLALWAGAWVAPWSRDPETPLPARPWLLAAWLAFLCCLRFGSSLHEDHRDMRLLADAARRADPSGTMPVAINTTADVQGFEFYLDGRPRHVRSAEVPSTRGNRYVAREAAIHAERGEPWLLVVADDPATDARVAKIAGDTAELAETTPRFRIYRIVPAPR